MPERKLFADLETYSPVPIKNGTFRYAEEAEVLLFSWAIDDEAPQVWDVIAGDPCPPQLEEAIHDPECLVFFHNGTKFDWVVLACAMPWVHHAVPLARRRDTMAQAYSHSLPGALEALCDALGVTQDRRKLKTGKDLIRRFCIPAPKNTNRERATAQSHPAEWAQLKEYATFDIIAMRECHRKAPTWNYKGKQLALEALDAKINARGVQMDVELAEAAVRASEIAKSGLATRTQELTDGDVNAATQRDEMLRHILSTYGVDLPDMQKDTIERRAADESLPEELRELLRVRLESTTTSVAKYTALLRGVNSDGRLRGTMQFRGAGRTGRQAHRLMQLGNTPRPDMKTSEIEWAIQLLKMDAVHLVYANVMKVCSNAIRGTIIAGPGKKLVVADLSSIEGRVTAWLAGEETELQAYRDYDAGTGPDIYITAYASSFNVAPESIDKKTLEGYAQRQIGKVCLAEGTPVVTDRGVIPIERVTTMHKLWDGESWVSHAGLVANGVKSVVDVAGIQLTKDHLVLTQRTWRQAQELVSNENILSLALATGSANLPWWTSVTGLRAAYSWCKFNARVVRPISNYKSASTDSKTKMRTFDLACAGPRNRFTVCTARGPLIVHNCTLMFGFGGGVGAWITGAATYGIDLVQMTEQVWDTLPSWAVDEAGDFLHWLYEPARAAHDKRVASGKAVAGEADALMMAALLKARHGLTEKVFIACDAIKRLWRKAHLMTASYWKEIEETAKLAINDPGVTLPCRRLKIRRDGDWLRIGLPSGRALCYPAPRLDAKVETKDAEGNVIATKHYPGISFMGVDQYSKRWQRLSTFGGRLLENAVQATAADQFFECGPAIEAAGFEIVQTVHDENICEAPIDRDDLNPEKLSAMMCADLGWNAGLPLAAAGWEGYRNHKE